MPDKFKTLRFRFEFGGESIEDLCAEHGYLITELQQYALDNEWSQQTPPSTGNPEDIAKFYTKARRELTISVTQRALRLYDRITAVEDNLLTAVEDAVKVASSGEAEVPIDGLELSRLAKVVESLQNNNRIFAEAFGIASQNDLDREPDAENDNDDKDIWSVEVVHSDKDSMTKVSKG